MANNTDIIVKLVKLTVPPGAVLRFKLDVARKFEKGLVDSTEIDARLAALITKIREKTGG